MHPRRCQWTYFGYDRNGSLVSRQEPAGTTYFSYSDADLVTMIQCPDATANSFHYDARLRRYAVRDSAGLSYFTWDENGMNLLAERDAGGSVTAEYSHGRAEIDGIGSLVAARKVSGGTSRQYPFYTGPHGDVCGLTDGGGSPVAYYEYNAWGEPLRADDPAAGNRFKYQSNWIELRDSGGRFYLSPTRVYDDEVGRFLGRDPSAEPRGESPLSEPATSNTTVTKSIHNLYALTSGSPLCNVDPTGGDKVEEVERRGEVIAVFVPETPMGWDLWGSSSELGTVDDTGIVHFYDWKLGEMPLQTLKGLGGGDFPDNIHILRATIRAHQAKKWLTTESGDLLEALGALETGMEATAKLAKSLSCYPNEKARRQARRIARTIEYLPMGKGKLKGKRVFTQFEIRWELPAAKVARRLEAIGDVLDKGSNALDKGLKAIDAVKTAISLWEGHHRKGPLADKLRQWRDFKNSMAIIGNLVELFPRGMQDLARLPFIAVEVVDPQMEIIANYALKIQRELEEVRKRQKQAEEQRAWRGRLSVKIYRGLRTGEWSDD